MVTTPTTTPMGISIQFDVALPGSTSESAALSLLSRLQEFAAQQQPAGITPVIALTRAELEGDLEPRSFEWMLAVFEDVMHDSYNLGPDGADANALGIAAFALTAGEGCDLATFALAPPMPTACAINPRVPVRIHDWHWAGFCKTQYASTVSGEHFVRCHRMIIDILDEAERLGFELDVRDEGRYWETHSVQVLLDELRRMNHLMTPIAGTLAAALSPHRVHPRALDEIHARFPQGITSSVSRDRDRA